ncbi:MAG TPA: metallophosphoesterase [Mycobacteriales bacterium]|nr:metallophosphoesterase [Mycobacteriales bacterium]
MPLPAPLLTAGLAAGLAAWPFTEPHLPVLRRLRLPLLAPGAAPLTVLHLSDLHLLPRQARKASWVRGLAGLRPDLVVATGDHISAADAGAPLAQLYGAFPAAGAAAVFVPGNNDWYSPVRPRPTGYLTGRQPSRRTPDLPWPEVAARLVAVGWTDLTHVRTPLELRGTRLVLTGTDDGHLRRDRYARVAGPVEPGALGVGVTHTPQSRLLRAFARDGHALVLAGHTHGGQLRVPGLGPLVTNCDLPRWRARGLTRDGGTWLHVSAGLGSSPYLPVRVCCRPEATLLELVAGPVR